MAQLQAEIKRGFLRAMFRSLKTGAGPRLLDILEAYQDQGFAAVKSGRLLIGTSGGGYSSSFDIPQIGKQFTQEQVFALSEELLSIHSDALITLSAAGIGEPTDQQIFDTMLASDRLQTVRAFQNDYTLLRWLNRY